MEVSLLTGLRNSIRSTKSLIIQHPQPHGFRSLHARFVDRYCSDGHTSSMAASAPVGFGGTSPSHN